MKTSISSKRVATAFTLRAMQFDDDDLDVPDFLK